MLHCVIILNLPSNHNREQYKFAKSEAAGMDPKVR